jgi:lipid-binding SYLF domain-containing protein
MRLSPSLFVSVVFSLLALSGYRAAAVTTPVSSIEWARQILDRALTLPHGGIAESVLTSAQAIAVFPDATRSGDGDGGVWREGIVVTKRPDGTWSNPALFRLKGASPGLSGAYGTHDSILVFRNTAGLKELEEGSLSIGKEIAVTGGPLEGAERPDAAEQPAIYSYSFMNGSLAGINLTGAVLHFDRTANETFYGKERISPKEVFTGKGVKVPVAAGRFKCALAMHTHAHQICG